jgi:hypothetical protein
MKKDIFLYILSMFIIGCAVGIVCLMVFVPIPKENHDAVMQISGSVITWGGAIVGYWVGSSKGSADKTDILKQLNPPT